MLTAHDLGMTSGEYVFYTIEMLPEEKLSPEDIWAGNDGKDVEAKAAFEAVFHVSNASSLSTASLGGRSLRSATRRDFFLFARTSTMQQRRGTFV